jgi:hypothetical protein
MYENSNLTQGTCGNSYVEMVKGMSHSVMFLHHNHARSTHLLIHMAAGRCWASCLWLGTTILPWVFTASRLIVTAAQATYAQNNTAAELVLVQRRQQSQVLQQLG